MNVLLVMYVYLRVLYSRCIYPIVLCFDADKLLNVALFLYAGVMVVVVIVIVVLLFFLYLVMKSKRNNKVLNTRYS